jgi:hypothetical protein
MQKTRFSTQKHPKTPSKTHQKPLLINKKPVPDVEIGAKVEIARRGAEGIAQGGGKWGGVWQGAGTGILIGNKQILIGNKQILIGKSGILSDFDRKK